MEASSKSDPEPELPVDLGGLHDAPVPERLYTRRGTGYKDRTWAVHGQFMDRDTRDSGMIAGIRAQG